MYKIKMNIEEHLNHTLKQETPLPSYFLLLLVVFQIIASILIQINFQETLKDLLDFLLMIRELQFSNLN